eukprot:gnl/TRDRNA2_/TRDRNA2_171459_c3_seq1.p1 gnl/TRDRNA2_/TRDRNA2_171459_c3~~gnl/TRDRNA2_/TRDRNA2_171459_c3_seq1.p1  ORF type:complete len:497 (+),score=81.83 gnl/TRDRNA2_/TRDRNA2_171459_c3_seq1:38-1528(+)
MVLPGGRGPATAAKSQMPAARGTRTSAATSGAAAVGASEGKKALKHVASVFTAPHKGLPGAVPRASEERLPEDASATSVEQVSSTAKRTSLPKRVATDAAGPAGSEPVAKRRATATEEAGCMTDAPWQGTSRARLLKIEMDDFKIFQHQEVCFEEEKPTCVTGDNSSGKSSVMDAIRFVTVRRSDRSLSSFIRMFTGDSKDGCSSARVTAHFQCEGLGGLTLRREIVATTTAGSSRKPTGAENRFSVGTGDGPLRQVAEDNYLAWISSALCWLEDDLLLPQFSLIETRSPEKLLGHLPAALEQLAGQSAATGGGAPLLKRRAGGGGSTVSTANRSSALGGVKVAAEAWLARKLDEIYRELTREPLDENMEEWGEGGQVALRRASDGTFTIFVSQQRGAAACGFGVPLQNLSDGDRDVCSLALLLTLPGLVNSMQEALPPFVALDEPDARLDKRHAKALWRFLAGPRGPKQCLIMSLNNHSAFDSVVHLTQPEPAVA